MQHPTAAVGRSAVVGAYLLALPFAPVHGWTTAASGLALLTVWAVPLFRDRRTHRAAIDGSRRSTV
jgi:hypothetical protein